MSFETGICVFCHGYRVSYYFLFKKKVITFVEIEIIYDRMEGLYLTNSKTINETVKHETDTMVSRYYNRITMLFQFLTDENFTESPQLFFVYSYICQFCSIYIAGYCKQCYQ